MNVIPPGIILLLWHIKQNICCTITFGIFAENYAPFQSMSDRESFLTINEGVAAAPGPGHYTPLIGSGGVKGGSSLSYKVSINLL